MNNMKINRLKIVNYKLFQNVTIEMNENINIFVGENDSGKSTILEALSMVLTGKINGSSVANRLNLDWFNAQVRQKFKESIEAGNTPDLPTIEIEVYFASPDEDEIAIKKYRGTNNSLHEDAEGVKLEIIFDTQYAPAYKQLLVEGKVRDIPVEYYDFGCIHISQAAQESHGQRCILLDRSVRLYPFPEQQQGRLS